MTKNKKIILGILAGVLILALILVVALGKKGNLMGIAPPAPPEGEKIEDTFSTYVYTDTKENGSYNFVTFTKIDDRYVMVQKYRDVGGQYWYQVQELSKFDRERFIASMESFEMITEEPDVTGAYESAVLTFTSSAGVSEYKIKPLDITGYGIVVPETSSQVKLISQVSDECNRFMPVKELSERLVFTSGAELGGYLQLVYDQVVQSLYGQDEETLSNSHYSIYGFHLKENDTLPDTAYELEFQCDKGIYRVDVTLSGFVYEIEQLQTAEEAGFEDMSITREVN